MVVSSEQSRTENLLTRIARGGKPRRPREWARLWIADADSGPAARLLHVDRPAQVRSRFQAGIAGWDPPADSRAVYVELAGHTGETSDSPFMRWMIRVELDPDPGKASAVFFVPNAAIRPPRTAGSTTGGGGIEVSHDSGEISARTEADSVLRPRFRVDSKTGDLVRVNR